jgi:hypothetical protein
MNDINPFGKYPLCKPIVGDPSSTCERCGGYAGHDLPCAAVPPNKRWGPDSGEWLTAEIIDRDENSVRLRGDDRINGASYGSPCFKDAQPGESWAVYWTRGVSVYGRIELAVRLAPRGEGESDETR